MTLRLLVILMVFLVMSCKSENDIYVHAGKMVSEVSLSLSDIEREGALDSIAEYGTDTRYYVLIRGWLKQELEGVESLLAVVKDEERKNTLIKKQTFLNRAIRRIDLE